MKKLYLPGPPAQIARIQESLQALQRSEDGWKLADALLASSDNKVRFFGALTFTVKLNLDWSVQCWNTEQDVVKLIPLQADTRR